MRVHVHRVVVPLLPRMAGLVLAATAHQQAAQLVTARTRCTHALAGAARTRVTTGGALTHTHTQCPYTRQCTPPRIRTGA
jgi:hypothetical protein